MVELAGLDFETDNLPVPPLPASVGIYVSELDAMIVLLIEHKRALMSVSTWTVDSFNLHRPKWKSQAHGIYSCARDMSSSMKTISREIHS